MLINVHFLRNHVDILLAAVILVITIKTFTVAIVVKGFGYSNKTSLLIGMSLAQIGEFAFVLLSRASSILLIEGKLYLLLLGTTTPSLVTTPLLFKMIPAVVHLGVLLRWFSVDINQVERGLMSKGKKTSNSSGNVISNADGYIYENDWVLPGEVSHLRSLKILRGKWPQAEEAQLEVAIAASFETVMAEATPSERPRMN